MRWKPLNQGENTRKSLKNTASRSAEKHEELQDAKETRETAASNEEEVENIDLSKQENEPPSQSQKEESVDKNNKELENLNTSETTVNVDTTDTLNTVELDSTISVAQNKNDNGTEAQSDSNKLEISSVVETQAIGESKKLAVKEEEPVASHQKKKIPEGFHRTKESDTTEHSKLRSSEEGNVVGNVGNLSPQVASDETPVINEGVRTSQMYPELDTTAGESVSSIRQYRMTLEAFSEDHLKTLYFNPLLEQMEGFVEHFIRISKQDDHEFYELVNTYFRGRNALAMAIKEYEIVLAECEKKKEQLWITKDFSTTAQGKCLDQVNVTHNHTYQQVELNPGAPKEIENMLEKLHKALHETLALQRYTCQLARLHIDMYIYDMLHHSSILSSVSTENTSYRAVPSGIEPRSAG
ncbi:hypothetical protein OS493_003709 [Desmophyllum pertusum]|uniref:Uncharacterized protein n=1 Tax=Desmophyllum pertusum TaxID=174260 RepID=A0A9X0A5Z7_9CNID|nr:hypothetical protein OS493_003709 [Desmophyllum pertusum]